MPEKIFTDPSSEREESPANHIDEVTYWQLNGVISKFGLFPPDGYFTAEHSRKVSQWAKQHSGGLKEAVEQADLFETDEDLDKTTMARLKLCLMTPRFIYAQTERDRLDHIRPWTQQERAENNSLRFELCEYNQALRDMVASNPDYTKTDLLKMLDAMLRYARIPEAFRKSATRMIEGVVDGAQAEMIMMQFAETAAFKEAGIVCHETTIEDDRRGIDRFVAAPVVSKQGQRIMESMSVDVKYGQKSIRKIDPNSSVYAIRDDRSVVICPLRDGDKLSDKILLDSAIVENRGEEIANALIEAAQKNYDWKMHRQMLGELAAKRVAMRQTG